MSSITSELSNDNDFMFGGLDNIIYKPKVKQKTSDEYKKKVKVFLDEIDVRVQKVTKRTQLIIGDDNLRLPDKNEQLRIRTQTQLNLIFVLLKIIETHKVIDNLILATYTFNKETFYIIKDLILSKKIKQAGFLIASSYSYRDADYFQFLQDEFLELNKYNSSIHFAFAWSHFKITLVQCGSDYYQMEGSMNYSQNNMAEQLLLENCRSSYDYDLNFINKIMLNQSNKALEIIC